MEFINPYFSNRDKIELYQRWLLVHAVIYYNYNSNIVSDLEWDNNAKEYLCFVKDHKNELKQSYYFDVFKEFEGNTGFDLMSKLKKMNEEHCHYLDEIAANLVSRKDLKK